LDHGITAARQSSRRKGYPVYRHCIYCSADLGTNAAIESFPIGRELAFDEWRGRLWAVCPMCTRWNLAPIEERWEPVEAAERIFRDARLRVHSENVGLARLPDGTRLIRVGAAIPNEMAAWRYGGQLLRRRKRHLVLSSFGMAAAAAAVGGLSAMGMGVFAYVGGSVSIRRRLNQRLLYRIPDDDASGGAGLDIRRWHVSGMRLLPGADPLDLRVEIRDASRMSAPLGYEGGANPLSRDVVVVSGETARTMLERSMVRVNVRGATRSTLREADRILNDCGSAQALLREATLGGASLGKKAGRSAKPLEGPGALAFEMALHEEQERRALEGELSVLRSAWREAEEIAAIADTLPGEESLAKLFDRLRL
jgi:hypothetical protein